MPSSASLRIPPMTWEPEKVSDKAGGVKIESSTSSSYCSSLEPGLSRSRISSRSSGAGASDDPNVPNREWMARRRFFESGERGAVSIPLDLRLVAGLFVFSLPCWAGMTRSDMLFRRYCIRGPRVQWTSFSGCICKDAKGAIRGR